MCYLSNLTFDLQLGHPIPSIKALLSEPELLGEFPPIYTGTEAGYASFFEIPIHIDWYIGRQAKSASLITCHLPHVASILRGDLS